MNSSSTPMIVKLPPSRYQEAADLCARAYQDDASVLKALGHLALNKKLRLLGAYWKLLIRFTARHGTALCIIEKGKLAGIKLFYTHEQYPPPNFSSLLLLMRLAFRLIPTLGFKRFFQISRTTKTLIQKHPQKPHFYSELTCVDPAFQRRGFYSLLKKEMIRLADEAGAGIYGETSSPLSARIIQKFGFRVTGEEEMGGVRYWFLWRESHKN